MVTSKYAPYAAGRGFCDRRVELHRRRRQFSVNTGPSADIWNERPASDCFGANGTSRRRIGDDILTLAAEQTEKREPADGMPRRADRSHDRYDGGRRGHARQTTPMMPPTLAAISGKAIGDTISKPVSCEPC